MKENIIIEVENYDKYIVRENSTVETLLEQIKDSSDVIAAIIDKEIVELSHKLKEDTKLKLIKTTDRIGRKIYRNGLKFLYITAIKELYGEDTVVRLLHSIDKGIYSVLDIDRDVTEEDINKIKDKMKELSSKNLSITKLSTSRKNAIEYFESHNELEKANAYKQMTAEVVTLYQLLNYYNYFYYFMPINTRILKDFDLSLINSHGIVLRYPSNLANTIPEYNHVPEVLHEFKSYADWCQKLGIKYASDVNNIVINGRIREFIQINELRHNEDINNLVEHIYKNKETLKFVLIAGPSCSGKTTTSRKLALFLKSKGLNPFIISVDDYYKDREDTPKDENGNYQFDVIEALDINLFNEHLQKLLNKEKVIIPTFNFITGEKEYKREPISIENRDIIIIEGLHTLNEKLTSAIDKKNKYKVYISPFTPLGLDRHNHVSTVDLRFLRRLVRDEMNRGYSAKETLKNWRNIRKQEELYVFPYQNEADRVINTALIYEIGVLKTYAVPLLYSVNHESEYYEEALRVINFLKGFLNIPERDIPSTSVLREFVGNGYFE